MEVISIQLHDLPSLDIDICACIGYFDGIHIGHQMLVSKCIEIAKEKGISSAMISFDPDPWTIFHPNENIQHITPIQDRIHLASSFGIDYFYKMEFTKEFAALNIDSFHELLNTLHVKHLVCGFDFRYASRNSGDITTLQNQKFDVTVIDSINDALAKISSSRIEPSIEQGKIEKANELLGYIYSIEGIVEHGFRRGSTLLNIPTANLQYNEEYITPGIGVYAGYALVNGKFYKAMINVGKNPTFDNLHITMEGHILDFNDDIYDQTIRFFFYKFIREEMKFESFNHLKDQLHSDVKTTSLISTWDNDLIIQTMKLWSK